MMNLKEIALKDEQKDKLLTVLMAIVNDKSFEKFIRDEAKGLFSGVEDAWNELDAEDNNTMVVNEFFEHRDNLAFVDLVLTLLDTFY